ncbi:hypothetical protein BLNAU_12685 [Blattamonas nauphoetae]|uniref:ENT domain-containing protein n=1 Tax=Blattamonas nauphoetae TaxID=2049346 RepID=A0ABQ9XJ08_9EUKA|nr:hypothetical protein BLNAU_12685 [Blattamonas nauphoetae]
MNPSDAFSRLHEMELDTYRSVLLAFHARNPELTTNHKNALSNLQILLDISDDVCEQELELVRQNQRISTLASIVQANADQYPRPEFEINHNTGIPQLNSLTKPLGNVKISKIPKTDLRKSRERRVGDHHSQIKEISSYRHLDEMQTPARHRRTVTHSPPPPPESTPTLISRQPKVESRTRLQRPQTIRSRFPTIPKTAQIPSFSEYKLPSIETLQKAIESDPTHLDTIKWICISHISAMETFMTSQQEQFDKSDLQFLDKVLTTEKQWKTNKRSSNSKTKLQHQENDVELNGEPDSEPDAIIQDDAGSPQIDLGEEKEVEDKNEEIVPEETE